MWIFGERKVCVEEDEVEGDLLLLAACLFYCFLLCEIRGCCVVFECFLSWLDLVQFDLDRQGHSMSS